MFMIGAFKYMINIIIVIKSSESDSKVNNVIFITLCSIYSFAFELRNGNGINSMSLASPTLVYHHPHAIGGRPVLH